MFDYNYELNYAHLSAINAARTMMKDIGDDEDWLPQFHIAICVWQEGMVRRQIGIPSLNAVMLDITMDLFNSDDCTRGFLNTAKAFDLDREPSDLVFNGR